MRTGEILICQTQLYTFISSILFYLASMKQKIFLHAYLSTSFTNVI